MSKTLNAQIIERARSLIEDEQNWCRGELARDGDGTPVCPTDSRAKRRCALGAFIAAAYEITRDSMLAHDLAFGAVRSFSGITTLVNINDARGHAAVLKQLDDAMNDVDAVFADRCSMKIVSARIGATMNSSEMLLLRA